MSNLKIQLFQFLFVSLIIEINGEIVVDENNDFKQKAKSLESTPLEGLCHGKFEHSSKNISLLNCYFKRDKPFLMLAPHKVELVVLDPLLLLFHDVISDTEIWTIKKLASKKLRRAEVLNPRSGNAQIADYRISKSAWLSNKAHPVIAQLNKRVHDMTNLDLWSAEDLQISSYGTGGHYAPHFDFFRANELNPRTYELYGNRVATVMFYLTQPHGGGRTIFTELNIGISPSERDALFWYNMHSDGRVDPRTRHAACPVLSGVKWVANKWLHERGQEFIRRCPLKMAQNDDME